MGEGVAGACEPAPGFVGLAPGPREPAPRGEPADPAGGDGAPAPGVSGFEVAPECDEVASGLGVGVGTVGNVRPGTLGWLLTTPVGLTDVAGAGCVPVDMMRPSRTGVMAASTAARMAPVVIICRR